MWEVNRCVIVIYFSGYPHMKHHQEDFFAQPGWPSCTPPHSSQAEPSQPSSLDRSSLQEQPLPKETSMGCAATMHISPSLPLNSVSGSLLKQENVIPDQPFTILPLGFLDRKDSLEKNGYSSSSDSQVKIQEQQPDFAYSFLAEKLPQIKKKDFPHKARKTYKILDKKVKKFLVKQTQYMTLREVTRIYDVSANNLIRWKKGIERRAGAGRKVVDHDMEEKLINWLRGELARNGGKKLTRKLIQKNAKKWSDNTQFKASKGWLERFVKRHKYLQLHQVLNMNIKKLQQSDEEICYFDSESSSVHLEPCYPDHLPSKIQPNSLKSGSLSISSTLAPPPVDIANPKPSANPSESITTAEPHRSLLPKFQDRFTCSIRKK